MPHRYFCPVHTSYLACFWWRVSPDEPGTEQLPQSAKQQPASPEKTRPSPPSSGKRLVLLLGLGLVILILIGTARLSLLKSALAKFEPIHPPKTVTLPASSAKISEHATDSPSVL